MGNTESKQDHYEVLGVHPNATETRITKAFRSAALKWHPEKRTPGNIDHAYRTLSNPTKRTEYDASRGSDSEGFGKGIVYITGICIVVYLACKLCRSGNSEEIAKAASELKASDAAPNLSASTVGKISQATMEKTMAIVNWALKWKDSNAASSLGAQLASSASTVGKIGQATMEKTMAIVNWAFKWKDSDAASSLGTQLVSTADTVGKISQSIMEKTINKASELKASDAASALGSQLASAASTVGKISQAAMEKTINKASELKASGAASSLGSQLASSASTVASASKNVLSKVAKWFQN